MFCLVFQAASVLSITQAGQSFRNVCGAFGVGGVKFISLSKQVLLKDVADVIAMERNRIPIQRNILQMKANTGKYFSEALILASTNPQYDKRLFIELQVQYMKIASSEHGENMGRTCCVHKLF